MKQKSAILKSLHGCIERIIEGSVLNSYYGALERGSSFKIWNSKRKQR